MLNISDVRLGPFKDSIYVKPFQMLYNQNGFNKTWDLIECHASVAIILFNATRNVLVCVKQFRPGVYINRIPKEDRKDTIDTVKYPPSLGLSLEFCAGMMDKNKPPEVTAAEEVLEECGYKIDPSRLEYIKSYRCGVGTSGEVQYLYYAQVTDDMKANEGGGIDDEILEVVEFSMEQGKELLEKRDLQCPGEFMFGLLWFFTNIYKSNTKY